MSMNTNYLEIHGEVCYSLVHVSLFIRPDPSIPWWQAPEEFVEYRKKTYIDTGLIERSVIDDSAVNTVRIIVQKFSSLDAFKKHHSDRIFLKFVDARNKYNVEHGIIRMCGNPKEEDLEAGLNFIKNWPVYLKDCRLRAIIT
jgi:hypothetical protein